MTAAAIALAHTDELALNAFTVPVCEAPALAAAFPSEPLVTWSTNDLTIVGIGVARELRGSGAARWHDVIAAARSITCESVIIDGEPSSVDELGFARPRFIGGAAFAPGAADRAPWHGFGDAWFVLPRWTYVTNGVRAMLVLAGSAPDGELDRVRAAIDAGAIARTQPPLVELQPAAADEWRAQVTAITDAIARGDCSKIVAARTCGIALAGTVDASALLAALDERHPDCVRVVVRPPHAGTLVAATPERLVRRDGRVVQCDALAGTIRSSDDDARQRLLASAKDRREHDLVVHAIRTALEEAGATIDTNISEPSIRALRHVLHLHTPFRATLRGHEPRHVLELAARLHPTPAVGGTPTATAIDWITSREPVARGWYASPVGWFDFDGNGELAVAIRSGVLAGNRAHLWAGAGIVAGSDPDRELAETDAKLRAMLGALGIGGAS